MKTLGYYNGIYDELDRVSIPMLDRACYFGDGVYDVTYCRNYHIFALDEHVDRFFRSADGIRITPPISAAISGDPRGNFLSERLASARKVR